MGHYENIVKMEEMRKRMEDGDVFSAQKILDTLDIKKMKNMSDLNLIAEVYVENERYDEAAELYLKIYDKTKSRKSLYQLLDISIKRNNAEEAQYYLAQYQKIAPRDFYRYVFRYRIDKLKGEAYEVLIETLEALKRAEYLEQWAYELAKTYYKAGMEKECIRECSDIILWFGEGTYVEKAKMLRSYYSGETDKDKIMEQLKRRAMEDTGKNALADQIDNTTAEETGRMESDELAVQLELDQPSEEETDASYDSEEDIYSGSDFMVEEETEEFEDGLKKDVQNILTQAWEEDPSYEVSNTDEIDNILSEETTFLPASGDEDQLRPLEETSEEEDSPLNLSEKELAEQEVEETIYQLLQEEDIDEEDKKLTQMAEELHLDLEEIFGNFLHIISIKKQLVKSLETILDEHTKMVQMIITGTEGTGKTTLAKDITLFLNKSGKLKSSKIAKIKAEKLNTIDVMSKKETLRDCCLVVEDASELKRQTIDSLLELSQCLHGNIAIIFEEDKKNMNKLFRECPKLMDLFKNRIHLPQYTQEDLMGFAYACLTQQEYRLSPKAESILLNKINHIIRQSEPHRHLEQIYDLMQSAMNAADIRTGKQLSSLAAQGKLKEVGVMSVLPEDFTIKL